MSYVYDGIRRACRQEGVEDIDKIIFYAAVAEAASKLNTPLVRAAGRVIRRAIRKHGADSVVIWYHETSVRLIGVALDDQELIAAADAALERARREHEEELAQRRQPQPDSKMK